MSVKMTVRELLDLWREDDFVINGVTYTIVECGDWDGAGEKYQSLYVIFTNGERNYRGTITRSGSYFSDWHYEDYGDADIEEVRKVERTYTVEEWRAV
ncbi:hypothetical protein BBD42_15430 [Paenibacillus sp. BIHB 4019]|uniref:Uncharacterized protein n=1 Tax=Paenibacillus sp. BIHB 4019 TaxID=1870819 RepID=A0A1B2DJ08_9BACL|nr:hypothetical protein [Paenibacillus sp. BIHB 4019]ANY67702.1 hypothetical protein BBD42_15430 [Paenibacillus sp. BIHB 4019]